MKKRYVVFVLLAVLIAAMCLSANAVDENVTVVSDAGSFVYTNNVTNILQSFDETNGGWDVVSSVNGNENVTLAEKIATFPFESLSGSGSLIYRNKAAISGKANTISRKYNTPLDLSEYSELIIAVNCSELSDAVYKIKLELKSGRRVFTAEGNITSCGWNCVFVDISEFSYRKNIDTFDISVSYENGDKTPSSFEYYIDSIGVSADGETANGLLYSAKNYLLSDGSSAVAEGRFAVNTVDGICELSSSGFVYKNMAEANCLRVDFAYDGICMEVDMRLLYADGQSADHSAVLEETRGKYLAYIPVGDKEISEIKLYFHVTGGKTLEINSIEPYSSYMGESNGGDTCALNYNSGEIIIRGSGVSEYRNKEIHLFSNDFCDLVTPESLEDRQSIAKTLSSSSDYIFRIKYSEHTDPKVYLFKKFTVAVKTDDGYVIIGNPKCVTNPENFVKHEGAASKQGSGKGIYGQSVEFMQEMGVSDTAIWVDIGRFFTLNKGGEFLNGGDLLYIDLDYVNSLNSQIRSFREKNIKVTLVAVLTRGQNEELNKILVHPNSPKNAKYCAFNTTTRMGLVYLRAFAEYVGENYCKDGSVSGICLGDGVAYSFENYNMGSQTLEYFTQEYGNALRTVYNAVRSHAPETEVYTYIDDNWDRRLPFDLYTRYDNRAFISSLGRYLSSLGDIEWSVAQDPYPQGTDNYYSFSDNTLLMSYETDRVSFRNIGVLDAYLSNDFLKYNNVTRKYIIIEKSSFTDSDEQMLTADYVYNCYKALNSSAEAYITNRKSNYNDAMKYIDTNMSLTASSFASDVLGVAAWENVIEGFAEEKIVKTEINSIKALLTRPEYKGSTVIADFSGDEHGFVRYGFSERLNSGMSLLEKNGLLSLSLGKIPQGEKRGIVKKYAAPIDLSKTPLLHFDINVASLPEGINTAEITVVLVSENNVIEVVGAAKEAVWTEIYCDVSAFVGLNKVEEIRLVMSSADVDFDEPQVLITSIEALSAEYDSQQLEEMFSEADLGITRFESVRKFALPLLMVVAFLSLGIFIIRRFIRK